VYFHPPSSNKSKIAIPDREKLFAKKQQELFLKKLDLADTRARTAPKPHRGLAGSAEGF
jgi:hypothetical protein